MSPSGPADAQSAGVDKFGIRKLYATKSGGQEWYIDMPSPTSDPRFNPDLRLQKMQMVRGKSHQQK